MLQLSRIGGTEDMTILSMDVINGCDFYFPLFKQQMTSNVKNKIQINEWTRLLLCNTSLDHVKNDFLLIFSK